jgi:hypothetical protein
MSHSPSPAAAAAAEAGAERPDDRQQLQQPPPPPPPPPREEEKEVFYDAPEEQAPPREEEGEVDEEEAPATMMMGNLQLGEEEDEFDEARTPVGLGAGGIISPAATAAAGGASSSHHHFHGDPALANTLEVCDVCEREECACDRVAVKRGVFFEGTPAETKRGGKPSLPHKPNRAIEPTSWRPADKSDFRSHHRPPHRDPHHASVASRDADFLGDVPHGEGGTRSGGKKEEEASAAPGLKPPPVSAIDAEVQPPVVPMPGKKGRPSHVGGDRIPALEVAHDPFERAGAPSSASGAGGRGHVAGHKHRGQRHQEFKTLG